VIDVQQTALGPLEENIVLRGDALVEQGGGATDVASETLGVGTVFVEDRLGIEGGLAEKLVEQEVLLGQQLRAIGFNLDFAPVLDVDTNPANPIIGDRAFGRTANAVIEHALAFADGLHAGGVLSCGKHFPGHGDTHQDSHEELPALPHDLARLNEVELPPFRAAVGRVSSVMTAHILFEALDPSVPATMSKAAVGELLRKDVGFEGAVFSDDLEMDAITDDYEIDEAGVLAVEAGCDLLLVCSDLAATAKLRETLAKEAEKSEAFASRLRAARSKADALRSSVLNLPSPIPLQNALESPEARALNERLGQIE
jgi:beta-N-acetylhexosaminidase